MGTGTGSTQPVFLYGNGVASGTGGGPVTYYVSPTGSDTNSTGEIVSENGAGTDGRLQLWNARVRLWQPCRIHLLRRYLFNSRLGHIMLGRDNYTSRNV